MGRFEGMAPREIVIDQWGDAGIQVLQEIDKADKQPMKTKEFLSHCVCCGGNWGGMLLSGIKELYPKVYDAVPNHMGIYAFLVILNCMQLLEIDMSEEDA